MYNVVLNKVLMIEYLSSGLNFNVLVAAINVKCQRF